MTYLQPIGVVAKVRPDGSIHPFKERTFELMLDQCDTQERQLREARRIIRALGYETNGVYWADNPGN